MPDGHWNESHRSRMANQVIIGSVTLHASVGSRPPLYFLFGADYFFGSSGRIFSGVSGTCSISWFGCPACFCRVKAS